MSFTNFAYYVLQQYTRPAVRHNAAVIVKLYKRRVSTEQPAMMVVHFV